MWVEVWKNRTNYIPNNVNIDICVKYWKIWKLYCFFNIPCICIFWYKIEELGAFSFSTITNNVLFKFKIPPTRKLNPSRGQMWFYLRKVLRLWGLILLMTNPLRNRHWLSASTSLFSQATIKRLFFLFPPFCYHKTFSIFSQQKFCSITNTFYVWLKILYYTFFVSSSIIPRLNVLCVLFVFYFIGAYWSHYNNCIPRHSEIDQTRRTIVINMIWDMSLLSIKIVKIKWFKNLVNKFLHGMSDSWGLHFVAFPREYNCLNFKFMSEINLTVMFIGDISILCRRAWGTFPFCQRWNHEIGNGLPTLSSNCTEFILGAGQTNLLTQLAVFDRA